MARKNRRLEMGTMWDSAPRGFADPATAAPGLSSKADREAGTVRVSKFAGPDIETLNSLPSGTLFKKPH
jgi:hypothetical protein